MVELYRHFPIFHGIELKYITKYRDNFTFTFKTRADTLIAGVDKPLAI
jgi:hypothetical protein